MPEPAGVGMGELVAFGGTVPVVPTGGAIMPVAVLGGWGTPVVTVRLSSYVCWALPISPAFFTCAKYQSLVCG